MLPAPLFFLTRYGKYSIRHRNNKNKISKKNIMKGGDDGMVIMSRYVSEDGFKNGV